MQLHAPDGHALWLAYGMNVHPGGTVASFEAAISETVLPLRERLGVAGRFGLALRFNGAAIEALAADAQELARLRDLLGRHELVPFTGNAFVLGDFDGRSIKDDVYQPPWSDPARTAYTLRFARVLAALSPTERELSLSTAPGSWRAWDEDADAERERAKQLARCAAGLRELHEETGVRVRLGLEPEPRCTIETTTELVAFLNGPFADAADAAARPFVGSCFDVCHQSVMHEDVSASLAGLARAGIPLVKLQASCALEVPDPADAAARAALAHFDEPVYLHQLAAPDAGGVVHAATDLGEVLADATGVWLHRRPWRVHFHVPVFRDAAIPPLRTTKPDLTRALDAVVAGDLTRHIEIETYTWDVLPAQERAAGSGTDLVEAIAREYESVLAILAERGIRPQA